MLRTYLKIALRRMRREPIYAAINIGGLALGLAVCLLIGLFIQHEFSYDRFHVKSDQIHRVLMEYSTEDQNRTFAVTPGALAPTVRSDFADVQEAVRIRKNTGIVQYEGQAFQETVLFVDSTFTDVFDFPLEQGGGHALGDPNTAVLSRAAALRYFGRTDVVGQPLTIDIAEYGDQVFTVGGVTGSVPETSSLQFGVLLPITKLVLLDESYKDPGWTGGNVNTYVQLHPAADAASLEMSFEKFITDRRPKSGITVDMHLQRLTDVHFSPGLYGSLGPATKRIYSYILGGVGIFVLVIACVNFMTLATARSARRVSEIGVRKAVGAQRRQLVGQFLGEALITSVFSVVTAVLLAGLLLPLFNHLVDKQLSLDALADPQVFGGLVVITVIVGLVTGSYPALYLSGFHPMRAFRDLSSTGQKHWLFRGLVTLQFSLAIVLVVGTLVSTKQLELLQNRNLGFDDERVVCLNVAKVREGHDVLQRVRTALNSEPRVMSVGGSFEIIGGRTGEGGFVDSTPVTSEGQEVRVRELGAAAGTIETLGIEMLRGREFKQGERDAEASGVLVNASVVDAFGWEDPLEHSVGLLGNSSVPVIGVVDDFHFRSLRHPVEPLMIQPTSRLRTIYVRVRPGSPSEAVDLLRKTWYEVVPDQPFNYTFLDQRIARQYDTEQRWAQVITCAAIFAIGIACLGLFGLAMLAAHRREQEIGIRKAVGASVTSIVQLLSKDFLKLVLAGFVIAAPLAYVGARRWLESFAYRIELGPTVFLVAGLTAVVIAFLAVSYQSIKAAMTNPAESLRCE